MVSNDILYAETYILVVSNDILYAEIYILVQEICFLVAESEFPNIFKRLFYSQNA